MASQTVAMSISRGFALSLPVAGPSAAAVLPSGLKGFSSLLARQPLGTAAGTAAVASLPILWGVAVSPLLEAHADAAGASAWDGQLVCADLKPILEVFYPVRVLKVLLRNVGIHSILRIQSYMAELLDNEKQALDAEERGETPPAPPPWPDMKPPLVKGFRATARELAVGFVRRVYEHIAHWRLGAVRSEPFLRDGRAWIRDVLAVRFRTAPPAQRFVKYFFANLHALAFFYAAECTVSVALVAHDTIKGETSKKLQAPRQRAARIAKHAALQVGRCSFLLLLVAVGTAGGSLIKPGPGTMLAHVGCEYAGNVAASIIIAMVDSPV